MVSLGLPLLISTDCSVEICKTEVQLLKLKCDLMCQLFSASFPGSTLTYRVSVCGRQGKNSGKLRKGRKASQGAAEEKSLAEKERDFTGGKKGLAEKEREASQGERMNLQRNFTGGPNTLFPSLLVLEKVLLSLTCELLNKSKGLCVQTSLFPY